MPFFVLFLAIVGIVVVALVGGRRARRSPYARDTALTGDSGVASTTEPDEDAIP